MSTTEHLEAILEFCRRNLAIAEKRTPGEWATMGIEHSDSLRLFAGNYYLGNIGNSDAEVSQNQANAKFIATCAGAAEAGWRATIASIHGVVTFFEEIMHADPSSHEERDARIAMVIARDAILAAYPLELIQT